MAIHDLKLRVQSDTKSYLAARATVHERSLNSEMNAILRAAMLAEPVRLHLTQRSDLHLVGTTADPTKFGAFVSRAEARAEAERLIASMPSGAACLNDQSEGSAE